MKYLFILGSLLLASCSTSGTNKVFFINASIPVQCKSYWASNGSLRDCVDSSGNTFNVYGVTNLVVVEKR